MKKQKKLTLEGLVKKWSDHVKTVREDWSSDHSKNLYSPQFKSDCVRFAKQKRGNASLVARAFDFDVSYVSDWKTGYADKLKKKRKEERKLKIAA